jgi:hypothetical protein
MERLEKLAMVVDSGFDDNEIVFFEVDEDAIENKEVLEQAKFKLGCIQRALEEIPQEYRLGTIASISEGVPFSVIAHDNTWRRWRKIFIRHLASELYLI